MEAQHEKQRHAAQTGQKHALPLYRPGSLLRPHRTYQRLQRNKVLDPPAAPGKVPSITFALGATPGHTGCKTHVASRVADDLPVANMVAST